ncbi:MAG TPA: type VI secretion system protein, partial [Luteimonas sp.]|nr:type VI secretion system protein [Luteimonas sp.]
MNLPDVLGPVRGLVARVMAVYRPVAGAARKPLVLRLALAVLLLALLVAVVAAAVMLVPRLPARFWQLLGLCAVALAVLWWFVSGRRRFTLHGRTRKRVGDLGPGNLDDEREPMARMAQAIAEAKRTIARSPEMEKGRDPLYRVPWMLFVGDEAADTDALLRAGAEVSPFPPPPGTDAGAVWRWWFFKSLLAIQLHPKLVCDPDARLERGLWYQALMLLAREREKLPLNGIVLSVSLATLLGPADVLKASASRLRRLVDEAMEHLQVRVPVYIVVSGLDKVRGYQTIRNALPAEAFAQALGHRLPPDQAVSAATSGQLDAILQPILDRLHALRLTALRAQPTATARRDVFEFVESLRRCESGLTLFVTLLLEDNTFQRTPPWRGLFFTGGADAANPGGAFVADLFTRFLPGDQPLATPSLRGSAARMAVAGLGAVALLGLGASLAHGLVTARHDDARLLAGTRSACREVDGRMAGARIEWVAGCGRTIERLESAADGALLGFGIRRADRDIAALRDRVTDDFENLILAPYDQMLSEDIARDRAGFEHALAIAQRLRLLDACRGSSAACLQQEAPHNVAFDARSRLFAPFVSATGDRARDRTNAADLFGAYLGYLRWQKKKSLDDERTRLAGQLQQLMAGHALDVGQVRAWADARGHGLALRDFWLPRGRGTGPVPARQPTVSRAFLRPTYDGVIAPFLDTAAAAAEVPEARVEAFRSAYFGAYFDAWAGLLSRFGDGAALWKGREPALLTRAAGAQNPYAVLFRVVDAQLFALPLDWPTGLRWKRAWSEMRARWRTAWRPAGRFVSGSIGGGVAAPPPWLLALQDTWLGVLVPQQPDYARAYLRLQGDRDGEVAYRIAADLFAGKGQAQTPPASDVAALLAAVDKPGKLAAGFGPRDLAAWSAVQGPVRLLLQLTVDRAGEFLERRWDEAVVRPLAALPAAQQAQALAGPEGRVEAFVGDWLAPFVSAGERAPVGVAGVALPLAPGVRALLAGSRAAPASEGPVPAGTFTLDGPSHLGTLVEGAQGTSFEVVCGGQVHAITSRGESLSDAQMQLQWSAATCPEARIRIALPPSAGAAMADAATPPLVADPTAAPGSAPPAPPPVATAPEPVFRLTLLYRGQDGFARLLEDFAPGAHVFALGDFRDSYSPSQWDELAP